MLTGTITKEDVAEFCGCLKEHVQEINFSDYTQIVFDASALEELIYFFTSVINYRMIKNPEFKIVASPRFEGGWI